MPKLPEIMNIVQGRYRSLQTPDFRWVQEEFEKDRYADFRRILWRSFLLDDVTDLNNDVSFVYRLSSLISVEKWTLRVSMVGPYAVVARAGVVNRDAVIMDGPVDVRGAEEALIVEQCTEQGLEVLDRSILEQSVPMILFDTSPERVRVYQALFEDTDFLPGEFDGLNLPPA